MPDIMPCLQCLFCSLMYCALKGGVFALFLIQFVVESCLLFTLKLLPLRWLNGPPHNDWNILAKSYGGCVICVVRPLHAV